MKRSMWFFGLLLAVAGLSSFRTADIAVSRPDRAQRRSLAKLERSYEYIRKMYVDSVDMAPLVEEAIRSMVQQLDPHTEYASAAEMAEFWSLYRGKFGGIGIQTQWIRDSLVVTSLLSGGAAEEAGIRPDDRIVRVDGRTVKEIPASELISVMRGDAGSKVKILVIRRGIRLPILYEIVRREKTGQSDRLIQQSSAIAPKIENQLLRTIQFFVSPLHLSQGRLTETDQFDVSHRRIDPVGQFDGGDRNFPSDDFV